MQIRFAVHDHEGRTEAGVMTLASPSAGRGVLDRLRPHRTLRPANAGATPHGSAELVARDGAVLETIEVPAEVIQTLVFALSRLGQVQRP
ncbi:MAG: hypothetical protein ACFBWO_03370 [Paracoccaceae bacterium]